MVENGAQLQLNAILAREVDSDGLLVLDVAVGVVAEEELSLQERKDWLQSLRWWCSSS